jgi:hypothetical protein
MSEERGEYKVGSDTEIQDAMDMLGKGYDRPSVIITPPHVTMERRDNAFKEVIVPAFVKISTDFKSELATIDEVALKVWLYIALSVNRYSGKANPGLRTISAGTGLAINTIRAALERLEEKYNLLTVDRESRKYNIYEPLAYVSANRTDPQVTVSSADTPPVGDESVSVLDESVSVEPESVSVLDESVSARVILNQRNQIKPEEPENTYKNSKNSSIEWLIAAGVPSEEIGEVIDKERHSKEITDCWEKEMGYSSLPWAKLEPLRRFLVTRSCAEIIKFAKWSRREYSTFTPTKARMYPEMVMDLWKQAFLEEPKKLKGDRSELLERLAKA